MLNKVLLNEWMIYFPSKQREDIRWRYHSINQGSRTYCLRNDEWTTHYEQNNTRGTGKMECWCGGIWRRNLKIMPGMWSLSWGPIIFQQQNTCFKQPLTRNPNYNKIDQSRAVLVETRIGPDTLPLATTSPSRHCWGTLVCPLEHCLETSAMSNGSSLNIIRCSVIGSSQGEQLECYTNCLSTK